MKNKLTISVLSLSLILLISSCSFSEIEIKEITTTAPLEAATLEEISSQNQKTVYYDFGEQFESTNHISVGETESYGSGTLLVTVESADVYNTLADAGIAYNEVMREISDGNNYDSSTGEFIKGDVLIMVHLTVENIDAIHSTYDFELDESEKYNFYVDQLGHITNSRVVYSSTYNSDVSIKDYLKFNLEPQEKKEIYLGYLVRKDMVDFSEMKFYGSFVNDEKGPIVNLELE